MNKELECLKRLDTKNYLTEREHREFYSVVEQALNRLEQIDNANPSEALNCLERLHDCGIFNYEEMEDYNAIKQALLKAQEPKKYLKWEDLEFNHTPKMIDVKMSGNKYKLVVGYNVAGKNLAILRDGKKEYYFLECDKQFSTTYI